MNLEIINVGTQINDPNADINREAWIKAASNFSEIESVFNSITLESSAYFNIGIWDMLNDSQKTVAVTLPTGAVVIGHEVFVFEDDFENLHNLFNSTGAVAVFNISTKTFTLSRGTFFQSTLFDNNTTNRGFVIVKYTLP